MKTIHIKKGLNLNLKGTANPEIVEVTARRYALCPDDFHGLTPKPIVKPGDVVSQGAVIFTDKKHPEVCFTAPIGGKVVDIVRGLKRRILRFEIDPTVDAPEPRRFDIAKATTAEGVSDLLTTSGCWTFLRQRPYDIIPHTDQRPKAIFISFFDTSPLPFDYEVALGDTLPYLQAAVDGLSLLTKGKVHISLWGATAKDSVASRIKGADIHAFSGKHPAGNVGTQIHHIDPIDKGDIVWTLSPQALWTIGKLFSEGIYDPERIVALCGSEVHTPLYLKTRLGAALPALISDRVSVEKNRFVSGGVLSGTTVDPDEGFLGFYHDKIVVLPEGDRHTFLGWLRPVFSKPSVLRAFTFSWLTPKKTYTLDTNTNGEERALVLTGIYDKVFPMRIMPGILLKSMLYEDIEEMEQLGIYEIAPEDYALAEYVCPSKTPCQQIVRDSLDLMIREVGN